VRIRLVDAEGGEVLSGDGTVMLSEPPAGVTEVEAGAILVFDVPFTHPGNYAFEIQVDGELQATVPLTVAQSPGPPAGGAGLH